MPHESCVRSCTVIGKAWLPRALARARRLRPAIDPERVPPCKTRRLNRSAETASVTASQIHPRPADSRHTSARAPRDAADWQTTSVKETSSPPPLNAQRSSLTRFDLSILLLFHTELLQLLREAPYLSWYASLPPAGNGKTTPYDPNVLRPPSQEASKFHVSIGMRVAFAPAAFLGVGPWLLCSSSSSLHGSPSSA